MVDMKILREKKGAEYAGTHVDDCLANFKRNAIDCGLSMEQIWRVYAGKHWDAVNQYIRDTSVGTVRDNMEPIDGRIDDLLVYLMLLKAMVIERREEREKNLPKVGEMITKVFPQGTPLLDEANKQFQNTR